MFDYFDGDEQKTEGKIYNTHTHTHINKGSQKCQADVTVYQGTQQRPQLHTLLASMQINCIVQCIDLYGEIVKSY